MQLAEAIAVACPRCDKAPLESSDGSLRCTGCDVDFPEITGIPWLFAEPGASLGEWRGRLRYLLGSLERESALARQAAADADATVSARERLMAMADAKADHAARLRVLLTPFELDALTATQETYLALRTKLPSDQGLLTYYGNVHRDWCWGNDENEASIGIVLDSLEAHAPERTLVLGAGAGRLAYDIHEQTSATATVALDFNPLLVTLSSRIAAGESIELYEFPLAPLDAAHQAVLRTLAAPKPAREGLLHCLADAHRPPFAQRAFDCVVTPWLVDILPEAFATLCKRINRLLTDSGRWINFGSLSFHSADPAEQLGPDECFEAIEAAGFDTPVRRDVEIPYLCSPASRHGRRETALCWSATKRDHVKKVPRHASLPEWLVRGKEPVPQLEHFRVQAISTRIHAFIMSLIDGRRSLGDMVQILEEQRLMTRAEAEPAVRAFLITLYEESRRRR